VIAEPEFRANLPRRSLPDADQRLRAHLEALAARLSAVLAEPATVRHVVELQQGFRYPRHAYDLPDLLSAAEDARYGVRAKGIRLVQQGARYGLVPVGSRAATEVPADVSGMVAWVLERPEFSTAELAAAFPDRRPGQRDQLLRDLGAMRLIEVI
jgi:hypothetical protein